MHCTDSHSTCIHIRGNYFSVTSEHNRKSQSWVRNNYEICITLGVWVNKKQIFIPDHSLSPSENTVFSRKFGPKSDKVRGGWKRYEGGKWEIQKNWGWEISRKKGQMVYLDVGGWIYTRRMAHYMPYYKVKKGKVITVQAIEALRVVRGWGSHIFRNSAHIWWQGCQPYAPAAFYPQEDFLVLISVRGWVTLEL
jgi:hypothetical protein